MTKKKFRSDRIAQGWRYVGWIVPPDIYQQVTEYKNNLMKAHLANEKAKSAK
jgi:hypothetical protein